jgi:hypothetical protein
VSGEKEKEVEEERGKEGKKERDRKYGNTEIRK